MNSVRFWLLAGAFAGLVTACGGGSSPAGPSGGGGSSSGSCRTFATAGTETYTIDGVQGPEASQWVGGFDSGTRKYTFRGSRPSTPITTTVESTYLSVADFVDEIQVFPPKTLAQRVTSINSDGTVIADYNYTYDSQRRLLQDRVTSSGGGGGVTTTYTAWDSAGRYTAFTQTGAVNRTYQVSYDDSTRTQTFTPITGGGPINIWVYNAAGIRTSATIVEGGSRAVITLAVTSTGQVCR